MPEDEDVYVEFWPSPEEAAIGSFPPAAQARVIEVHWHEPGEAATVHIKVSPDYDYYVGVFRTDDGWFDSFGHN